MILTVYESWKEQSCFLVLTQMTKSAIFAPQKYNISDIGPPLLYIYCAWMQSFSSSLSHGTLFSSFGFTFWVIVITIPLIQLIALCHVVDWPCMVPEWQGNESAQKSNEYSMKK